MIKKKFMLLTLMCTFLVGIIAIVGVKAVSAEEIEKEVVYDSQRSAHDNVGDGWVNVFEINYAKDGEKNSYLFDGYNLKYKELDGYYIPVLDIDGKEVYRVTPNYITLSISEKHKKDVKEIGKFFNKKQFNSEITIDDLNDLKVTTFEKTYLVELFNRAIKAELKTNTGDYYNNSFINKVEVSSSDDSMKGDWQISYLIDFGYISEVNIEFISSEGNYMSDLENSKDTLAKKNMLDDIEKIENSIIKNQSFEISNESAKIFSPMKSNGTSAINNDIYSLLQLANKSLYE